MSQVTITMYAIKQRSELLLECGYPTTTCSYASDGSGNPYRLHADPTEAKLFAKASFADRVVYKMHKYVDKYPSMVKVGRLDLEVIPVTLTF